MKHIKSQKSKKKKKETEVNLRSDSLYYINQIVCFMAVACSVMSLPVSFPAI